MIRMCGRLGRRLITLVAALVLARTIVTPTGFAVAAEDDGTQSSNSKPAHKAPPPQAKADLAAAKEAYEDALRAFNLGMWDEAVAGFQKSYRLSGDPTLLFNVGQAQRQAGHVKEAIVAYKAYLREKPETPHRKMIEARIKDLESGPSGVVNSTDRPADTKAPSDQLTGIWEDPFEIHRSKPDPSAPQAPVPASPMVAAPLSATPGLRATAARTSMPQPAARVAGEPVPLALATSPANLTPAAVPAPLPAGGGEMARAPASDLNLRQQPAANNEIATPDSVGRWWLWAGIGTVVVAGVVTAVLLSTRGAQRDGTCPTGLDGCIPVGK